MKLHERYPWYLLDLVLYVVLNIVFLAVIHPRFDSFLRLSPFAFILFGLAVYRIANIIANETITKPIRAPFVFERKTHAKVEEVPKHGLLGSVGSLIYCPSCTGVWIATILIYTYLLWPGAVSILVIIFAVSSLERIFTEGVGKLTK